MKQILRKRTQFETALVRRVAKKSDFLRYAAYEMGLEQLRRKRLQRLSMCTDPHLMLSTMFTLPFRPPKIKVNDIRLCTRPETVSNIRACTQEIQGRRWALDTVCPGRKTRRCTRFSGPNHRTVGPTLCRPRNPTNLERGLSALQLHPHVPSFYILAASHELSHMSPSAARSLLQRGLRLNSDSVDMWREYIRMELNFVEGMRRRWNVLGINKEDDRTQAGREFGPDFDMDANHETLVIDEQREQPPDEVVAAEQGGDEGEAARKAIMAGAIVKSALSSAAKGVYSMSISSDKTLSRSPSSPAQSRTLCGTRSTHSHLSMPATSSYHTIGPCLFPIARSAAR